MVAIVKEPERLAALATPYQGHPVRFPGTQLDRIFRLNAPASAGEAVTRIMDGVTIFSPIHHREHQLATTADGDQVLHGAGVS